MAQMRDFESEAGRAVGKTWDELTHPFRHHQAAAPQAPATRPAVTPASNGGTMSLTTIEDDVRADLTDGLSWLSGFVQRVGTAMPGIISTVDTVSNSTVGKLAETLAGTVIPPQMEPFLVNLVDDFARRYGQPAPAQPAQPAAPAPAAAQQ